MEFNIYLMAWFFPYPVKLGSIRNPSPIVEGEGSDSESITALLTVLYSRGSFLI